MIALAAGAVIASNAEIPFKEVGWFTLLFSSLLPDIDEPSSTVSKPGSLFLPFLPRPLQEILNTIAAAVMFPIRLFTKHRGITHAPIFFIGLTILVATISPRLSSWFALGYGSHLFADFLTPMGIPAFWPFSEKKARMPVCKTGSATEWLIFFLSGCVFCFSCWSVLQQN